MKHYESIIIGHISMDNNIDHLGNSAYVCGGAVLYSSASAASLGHTVAAVTRLAQIDNERLLEFTIPKEDVYAIECAKSTTMKNVYFTPDKERRNSSCLSMGTPFELPDIPKDISADIYHFAGLVYGDFPNEMIKECAKKGKIALDVQTSLRHVNTDTGEMYFEDWECKKEMLPYIHFLKTDAAEAEIMTGTSDRYEAAKILYGWGAKEVLITHNTEVIAYDGEKHYSCPIRARNLSGRTGRGDTTFAAYVNERLTNGIEHSLLYATATVSLKMETPGPLKKTREDIENYIKEFYPDFIK
ncbi:MAG: ribokinase [Oscillospiraceae bacterium]|nr:ribokinase [Oscillospiraceae bacterium]